MGWYETWDLDGIEEGLRLSGLYCGWLYGMGGLEYPPEQLAQKQLEQLEACEG